MNISPLSFGKKIPIAKCQIQERETGKFVPATVYEVDCADEDDFLEIKNLNRKWSFKKFISENMESKHFVKNYLNGDSCLSFYQIRDNNDEIIGIGQTREIGRTHDLSYIDTKPKNQYRFVGQTLLAAIGKSILNQDGFRLIVSTPIDSSIDFYEKSCGFEKIEDGMFKMNRSQIQSFISRTEERTHSPLISLKE